jgi:hypothetical protein
MHPLTAVTLSLMADLAMSVEIVRGCLDVAALAENHDGVRGGRPAWCNSRRHGRVLKFVKS